MVGFLRDLHPARVCPSLDVDACFDFTRMVIMLNTAKGLDLDRLLR